MEIVLVILLRNDVVEESFAIIGYNGTVKQGRYSGKSLSSSAEDWFYKQCCKINKSLPSQPTEDFEDHIEDGFYMYNNQAVFLTWTKIV